MKTFMLSFMLFLSVAPYAQDIPYYSTTSMQPWQELTNPVSVNNGGIWNSETTYPVYFNFNFTIYDQSYSSLNVDAGGGIVFVGLGDKNIRVFHTPFGGYLLKDRGTTTSLSDIDYEVSGQEGQYIIRIQWKNAGFVQWYSTSDPTDFVDFQIWIFQEDAHIELHFGNSQTDPGTYGYPDATSDPDPGPSIKFMYDDCSNILSYFSIADNPSYDYFDMCTPNYSFIDGTPSEGITYTITPNDGNTSVREAEPGNLVLFPNPASDYLRIKTKDGAQASGLITIADIFGKTVLKSMDTGYSSSTNSLDIRSLPDGIYFLKIKGAADVISRKFVKRSGRQLAVGSRRWQ